MADPRLLSVEARARRDHLSPLMRRKANSLQGEVVNACPFGCEDEELNRHGYCRHLVGFTTMADAKGRPLPGAMMEPRVVQRGEFEDDEREMVDGRNRQPVLKTDHLERITSSYRVYRDVDNSGAAARPVEPPEDNLLQLTPAQLQGMIAAAVQKAVEEVTGMKAPAQEATEPSSTEE